MVGTQRRVKFAAASGSGPLPFHLHLGFSLLSQLQSSPSYPHITILSSPPIPIPPPLHNTGPLPSSPHKTISESLISPNVKNKPYLWAGGWWESISSRSAESLTATTYQAEGGGMASGGVVGGAGGIVSASVFPPDTCCLFDFALSQDKH